MNKGILRGRYKVCIDQLDLTNHDVFLDIGCGGSAIVEYVARFARFAIGIDVNSSPVCDVQLKKNGENIQFLVASASHLPFKDENIDKIAMLEVLEHIPLHYEMRALNEIQRVLKKSGKFVISLPNRKLPAILFDPAFFLKSHRHYAEKELLKKIKSSDLSVIRKSSYGGLKQAFLMLIWYVVSRMCRNKADVELPLALKRQMNQDYLSPKRSGYTLVVVGQK